MKSKHALLALSVPFAMAENVAWPNDLTIALDAIEVLTQEGNYEEIASVTSAIVSDLESIIASATTEPAFSSFTSALASAAGTSMVSYILATTTGIAPKLNPWATGTDGTPTWWTAMPTSEQAYFTSFVGEQFSEANRELSSGAMAVTREMSTALATGVPGYATYTPATSPTSAASAAPLAPLFKVAAHAGAGIVIGAALLLWL